MQSSVVQVQCLGSQKLHPLACVEGESQTLDRMKGATTWTPLELAPIELPPYPLLPTQLTPFTAKLPNPIPDRYLERDNQKGYLVYCLFHLKGDEIDAIINSINPVEHDTSGGPKAIAAPEYAYSTEHSTLRDVYNYHISLHDGGCTIATPGRFVVVTCQDWKQQGVLVVELDCDPKENGKIGMVRVDINSSLACLKSLEESNRNWSLLKAIERNTSWAYPITGYSGSTWNYQGDQDQESKWLKHAHSESNIWQG